MGCNLQLRGNRKARRVSLRGQERAETTEEGKPLSLWPGAIECCSCGYCCRHSVCTFGKWDESRQCCVELEETDDGYACRQYERIIKLPQEHWWASPAFGAGCCSPSIPTVLDRSSGEAGVSIEVTSRPATLKAVKADAEEDARRFLKI